jgi:hypothetical protein
MNSRLPPELHKYDGDFLLVDFALDLPDTCRSYMLNDLDREEKWASFSNLKLSTLESRDSYGCHSVNSFTPAAYGSTDMQRVAHRLA